MNESISRRSTLRLLAVGLGGLVVAACSTAAPTSPTSSAPTAPAPTPGNAAVSVTSVSAPQPTGGVPKAGGTIRTGQVGDIANLDGHYANQLSATTVQLAYEKLVAYDTNLQPQPVLAESWDISADSKTFKLNLRKGGSVPQRPRVYE